MLTWNEKLYKKLYPFGQTCFYLGLILELLIVVVDKSAYINPIEGQLFRITFVLFGLKLVCSRYTIKEWLWILGFGLIAGICYLCSTRDEVVRLVVFVAAFQDVDLKKALKLAFWTTFAGCVILMLLSITGIYGNLYILDAYDQMNLYCFGLGHPNAFYCMLWALMTLGTYLYHENIKWWHFCTLTVIGIVAYMFTRSKTGFLLWIFTLMLVIMMRYWRTIRDRKGIYFLGVIVLVCCVAASVWMISYGPGVGPFARLNEFLTGRITSVFDYNDNGGVLENWRLFSRPENDKYFDMAYVRLFYWYGYIPGALYIIMYALLMWNCGKRKDYMGFVMLLSFAIYTTIEAHFVSVYLGRNYALFLLGAYWPQLLCKGKKEA